MDEETRSLQQEMARRSATFQEYFPHHIQHSIINSLLNQVLLTSMHTLKYTLACARPSYIARFTPIVTHMPRPQNGGLYSFDAIDQAKRCFSLLTPDRVLNIEVVHLSRCPSMGKG